jgi:RHS repeat-associated protein
MLGTNRVILPSAAGSPCYDADFYPFGGEREYTASCAENYKFEGKKRDQETGNDDFGARYYSSSFGRWESPDWSAKAEPVPYAKLDDPQSLNLYGFVKNNPASRPDVDGHQEPEEDLEREVRDEAEFYRRLSEFSRRDQTQRAETEARNAPPLTPEQQKFFDNFFYRSGGRPGGTPTRSQNAEIGDALESGGYKITGGAGRAPEEAIKGPDGTMKGGTYVDITATKDGHTVRVQTVTTLADGKTPTPAEQAAAQRIREAFPNDRLYLIPKQSPTQ